MTLSINIGKVGAPHGEDHPKVKVLFSFVELARSLKEHGKKPREIKAVLGRLGCEVSYNTLADWLYFKTRIYG
jgi:hypothetical protein